jgi:DNA-binding transcriptional regulator PaaX
LLGGRSLTLGEVLVKAKAATETRDSRRTEMFFVRSGRSAQVAIIRPSSVVRRLVSRFRFSYKAVTLRQLTTDQGF